ncbi:Transcriptional regulators, LysR family [plant metagenome]|uniref:Transcriptional regulators, LysR family n=1 Tax=plant metagenome TaxID=1297885 RepID=A0A484TZ08_9ZZZZ
MNTQLSLFTCLTMKVSAPRPRALLGQVSDMDLRLLRVFKAVVDCGGMAAAELELNIGISTISRHIKDLETRIGLVLCRRGRAGFALTDEGRAVHEETQRLLGAMESFRGRIDAIHDRLAGELHVAVFDKTATHPQARLDVAIARYGALAPAVTLTLHVAGIGEIEQGILDGRYQVGVIPEHRRADSLVYADLYPETMHLYCGAGHPLFGQPHARIGWPQLRDHAFAGLGYHSPNMAFSHQAKLTRAATGFDQEAIATLVLSGRYLGFLPDHYAEVFERQGRIQAVAPQRLSYVCRFVSIVRRSPQPSRAARLFHDCLAQAHAASSLAS